MAVGLPGQEELVSFAIIDAAAGADGRGCGWAGRSRYCTPIANLPLICHVLDELVAGRVDRARVLVSPGVREELEEVLANGRSWSVEVTYTDVEDSDGRSAMLAEIEQLASDEPVLLYPGDCLFPGQISAMWELFNAGDVDAVVLAPNADSACRGGAVAAEPASDVALAPAIVGPAARAAVSELGGPELDDGLAERLRARGCRVGVCQLAGHWRYSDTTEALLSANGMMLDALAVPPVDGSFENDNEVHGRVVISPSARVSGCTLHGPVAVDDGAIVEDSFVGPYTAIGAGAVVSGTEIDNAMVLVGAELRHPGYRIEASIIGERASVVRSFALPKGLHLRLEPHSRVTLS